MIYSQELALVGTRTLTSDSTYEVYLSAQNLDKDSIVNITLENVDEKVFLNSNGQLLENIKFEVRTFL